MTLAGVTISVNGITTPYRASVSQLRNQAIEYYSKYINAFEASNRDYTKLRRRHRRLREPRRRLPPLGGSYHRKAIKDQETLLGINPNNANYWRNIGVSLDALREGLAAKPFYQKYVDLNGPYDLGEVGSARARLAQQVALRGGSRSGATIREGERPWALPSPSAAALPRRRSPAARSVP